MGKLLTLIIIASLCCSLPAMAQIDPDPNGVGIYFDEEAFVYCTQAGFGANVEAYLCLTRISAATGVSYWEARVEVSHAPSVNGWNLRGQAINVSTPPEFRVAMTEVLPWASSLVVLEISLTVGTQYPIGLRVHPIDEPSIPPNPFPLPAYAAGDNPDDLRSLGYSWGWDPGTGIPNWCAVINPAGDCEDEPTETEGTSWGQIKAVYR